MLLVAGLVAFAIESTANEPTVSGCCIVPNFGGVTVDNTTTSHSHRSYCIALVLCCVVLLIGLTTGQCKRPLACAVCMRRWRRARYIARGHVFFLQNLCMHVFVCTVLMRGLLGVFIGLAYVTEEGMHSVHFAVLLGAPLACALVLHITAVCVRATEGHFTQIHTWVGCYIVFCTTCMVLHVLDCPYAWTLETMMLMLYCTRYCRRVLVVAAVMLLVTPVSAVPGSDGAAAAIPGGPRVQQALPVLAGAAATVIAGTVVAGTHLSASAAEFMPGQCYGVGHGNGAGGVHPQHPQQPLSVPAATPDVVGDHKRRGSDQQQQLPPSKKTQCSRKFNQPQGMCMVCGA